MIHQECTERLRLVDEYSRAITDFNSILHSLKRDSLVRDEGHWRNAEVARVESQKAWQTLEGHITEHACLAEGWCEGAGDHTMASGEILQAAAMAALDMILVMDDERRLVAVNEAAARAFGMPHNKVVGRRVDEFILEARGKALPETWAGFIAENVQRGVCAVVVSGTLRSFEYRAKANFTPGLHLSILREM